jgi:diaminopimelate decarboxylase
MMPMLRFDLDRLILNCDKLKKLTSTNFHGMKVKIYYAVKANPDEQVLSTVFSEGIGAEVLSLHELMMIPEHVEVVVNGHCKSQGLIEASIQRENCILNIESLRELEIIQSFLKNNSISRITIGLRITISDNARIGFSMEDLLKLSQLLRNEPKINLSTLHFHAGWNVKDDEKIHFILNRMRQVNDFLKNEGIKISCWNYGGSFAEASSCPEQLQRRLQLYAEALPNDISEVRFEPGRYLVGDCGKLEAQVIEIRENQVILNAATYGYLLSGATPKVKFISAKTLSEIELLLLNEDLEEGVAISGIWPSENDCLRVIHNGFQINVGDTVVFENMGAYLAGTFSTLSDENLSYDYESNFLSLWSQSDIAERSFLLKFWCFNKKELKTLPKKLTELRKMLGLIAKVFEFDRSYSEREVNLILLNYNKDFCTLRRELVEQKYFARNKGAQVFYERVI